MDGTHTGPKFYNGDVLTEYILVQGFPSNSSRIWNTQFSDSEVKIDPINHSSIYVFIHVTTCYIMALFSVSEATFIQREIRSALTEDSLY